MEQADEKTSNNEVQEAAPVIENAVVSAADANKIQVLKKDLSKDEEEMK